MRILVAGATGFMGSALIRELASRQHEVVALVRRSGRISTRSPEGVTVESWDGRNPDSWTRHIENVDVIINFAGTSIAGGRWTDDRKKLIVESRVNSTRAIVQAIAHSKGSPQLLVNASAVGYYGTSGDEPVSETSSPGTGFLARTCQLWEAEALKAGELNVRVVLARFGVVLGPNGGALHKMLLPFRFFIGGPLGSGKQWYAWIHRDDAIGALLYIIEHPEIKGAVNVVAPEAVTMETFARELGRALRRPSWMRVPASVLRLGLGEMAGMVLEGRQVKPVVLADSGFAYRYPQLRGALEALVGSRSSYEDPSG